jgi:hypothetical protein
MPHNILPRIHCRCRVVKSEATSWPTTFGVGFVTMSRLDSDCILHVERTVDAYLCSYASIFAYCIINIAAS